MLFYLAKKSKKTLFFCKNALNVVVLGGNGPLGADIGQWKRCTYGIWEQKAVVKFFSEEKSHNSIAIRTEKPYTTEFKGIQDF